MRPQEARRRIKVAFDIWMHQLDKSNLDIFRPLKKSINKLIDGHAKRELDAGFYDERYHKMYYEECLPSFDSCINRLEYISDRFNCIGRLKFMKAVLELYE